MVMQKIAFEENLPCTCFFFFLFCGNQETVLIKFRLKCTISLFNKCGIGPDKHIYQ